VALNVATDLGWFDRIIPCGIDGSEVASLESLGAPGHTPELVAPVLAGCLATAFGRRLEDAGPLTAVLRSGAPASSAA
jgi:lipoyl(octanoyl) transferase